MCIVNPVIHLCCICGRDRESGLTKVTSAPIIEGRNKIQASDTFNFRDHVHAEEEEFPCASIRFMIWDISHKVNVMKFRFLLQTGRTLALGYILYFYSERLFWTTLKPTDKAFDHIIGWLLYSSTAYLFLCVITWFRVRRAHAVFLAGAVYGWLVEGVLTTTLYGTESSAPFPLSVSCTGLSWHALISVMAGYYLGAKVLEKGSYWQVLAFALGIGLFWGCWAPFQWQEVPPVITPVPLFLLYGFVVTVPLVLGYWLVGRLHLAEFTPGWIGVSISVTIHLLFFWNGSIVTLGWKPLLVLPPLLLFVGLILLRNRHQEPLIPAEVESFSSPPKVPHCLILFSIPVFATLVYGCILLLAPGGIGFQYLVWMITIPLGFILLIGACLRVMLTR